MRELVRPPSRAFSLSTLKKLSRSEGSYVENTYTGGSADSESPVALRPSLARGLPLTVPTNANFAGVTRPCQLSDAILVTFNHPATGAQPTGAERSYVVHATLNFDTPYVTSKDVPDPRRRTPDLAETNNCLATTSNHELVELAFV